MEAELPDIELLETNKERDLTTTEPNIEPPVRVFTPLSIPPLSPTPTEPEIINNENRKCLNNEYYKWFTQPTERREVEKPNAIGKL